MKRFFHEYALIAIATPSPSTPTRASETSVAIFIRRFSAADAAAAPPFFSAKKWRFREPYPTGRVKYGPSSLQHEEKGRLKILPNMQSRDDEARLRMNFQYGNEKDPMNGSQFRWEGRVSLRPAELTDKHLFLP